MASPLPIHHLRCTADKLQGGNKALAERLTPLMKAKTTPMAITACTPHLFNTTGRACLGTREVISKLLLVGGGLHTLTEKKKHAICLHMKWKVLLHQHLRVKSKRPISHRAAEVHLCFSGNVLVQREMVLF